MNRRPPSSANRPSNRDDSTRPSRSRVDIPYPGAPDPRDQGRRSPKRSATVHDLQPTPPTVWTAGPEPIDPADPWPVPIIETITTSFSASGARVLLAPWPTATRTGTRVGELDAARDAVLALHRQPVIRNLAPRGLDGGKTASTSLVVAERAELIITFLPPECVAGGSVEALAIAASRTLMSGGILAVYTRSEWSRGRLIDPTGPMIAAAQNADLLYLQHIVTLHTPIRNGRLQPPTATRRIDMASGERELCAQMMHTRVHGDVLVFAQAHAGAAQEEVLR